MGLWGLLVLERFILRQVPTRVGWFPGSKGDFSGFFLVLVHNIFQRDLVRVWFQVFLIYLFQIWDWDLVLVFCGLGGGFGFNSFFIFKLGQFRFSIPGNVKLWFQHPKWTMQKKIK